MEKYNNTVSDLHTSQVNTLLDIRASQQIAWASSDKKQDHENCLHKRKRNDYEQKEEDSSLNKKPKLTHSIDFSSKQINDIIIFPPDTGRIANNFIHLLNGDYILTCNNSVTEETSSNNSNISQQLMTVKLTLPEDKKITANTLEKLYQLVAKALLEDHSIITVIEYLIRKNYSWNKVGNFKESLLHYFITLPDIMLALDKFNRETQIKLLEETYDKNNDSPLILLAKLYCHDFEKTLYKNLKDCFDIILDFDNTSDHSTSITSNSEEEIYSAFETILVYCDKAFQQDQATITEYLEILALMCIHTDDRENNYDIIIELFDDLKISETHYTVFNRYYKHYEKLDEETFNDEFAYLHANGDSQQPFTNTSVSPSFFKEKAQNITATQKDTEKNLSGESSDNSNTICAKLYQKIYS